MALPAADVEHAADGIARRHEVRDVSLPQSGLGLLALRDGALHEAFFIGEVPLARARVVLRTADGGEAPGGAVLLDDRGALARAVAVLDAALAARLPGWEEAAALVRRGTALLAETDALRSHLLRRTRVDFALLGQAEETGDE